MPAGDPGGATGPANPYATDVVADGTAASVPHGTYREWPHADLPNGVQAASRRPLRRPALARIPLRLRPCGVDRSAAIDPTAFAAGLADAVRLWFAGLDPHGWRTTIVAAVLMIGVVFGVNIVNAAVLLLGDPGTVDPGPQLRVGRSGTRESAAAGQPVTSPNAPGRSQPGTGVGYGSGVVVYPPAGGRSSGRAGQTIFRRPGTS